MDGTDLIHAQLFLLAGLYQSQFAKVGLSLEWIRKAGRVCSDLLDRYNLVGPDERFQDMQSPGHGTTLRNLILISTWTSIQLECELTSDLHLAPGVIRAYEGRVPWPTSIPGAQVYERLVNEDGRNADGASGNLLVYYTGMISLQRQETRMLNDNMGSMNWSSILETLRARQDMLRQWRVALPSAFQWQDHEPFAPDILAAKLRAKFLRVNHVALMPYLDYILQTHIRQGVRSGRYAMLAATAVGSSPCSADTQVFDAIGKMPQDDIWQAAKACMDAAAQNIYAFDGVRPLIDTNIHGTANA